MVGNRITIRDVAREAGFSIATVSKALNGVDVVKPDTKSQILAVADRLHYVPNLMGKQLKNAQTKMLGFYTNSLRGPYFGSLVQSIAQEAEALGYGINVFITTDKKLILNSIMGNVVDGIIGFEDLIDEKDMEAIKQENIKAVFIDRRTVSTNIGSVVFDSYRKGRQVTEYLIEKGHQKIAFINGFTGVFDSDERYRGFCNAMQGANLIFPSSYLLEGKFEEAAAFETVLDFLESTPYQQLPTAFVCGNDLSAIGVCKAILEKGFDIPSDFSIVGFDGIDLIDYFEPQIATIKNPIEEQGRVAVRHLIDLIDGKTAGKALELSGVFQPGSTIRTITRKE